MGGSLGKSLFLNSVSELSMMTLRASISLSLQRELAKVLLRFRDLLVLWLPKTIYLRSDVRDTYSKTSIIAVFTAKSLLSKESTISQISLCTS